jgi:hypothetical protein
MTSITQSEVESAIDTLQRAQAVLEDDDKYKQSIQLDTAVAILAVHFDSDE